MRFSFKRPDHPALLLSVSTAVAIALFTILIVEITATQRLSGESRLWVLIATILFITTLLLAGLAIWQITREQFVYARDLQAANRRLRALAMTDGLTGIFNHRYFAQKLNLEWKRRQRLRHPLACVMIDIDNFKSINDHYGHHVGDIVLQKMADLLRDELREIDIISRYGGEEFAIAFMEKPSHLRGLRQTMERIRKRIEKEKFAAGNRKISITASFGGALAPHPKIDSPNKLIQAADRAMYRAKKAGKNCSRIFGE